MLDDVSARSDVGAAYLYALSARGPEPMTETRLVYPGDQIGVAEEFVPGPGTYEQDGMVYAATLGQLHLDTTEFEARVKAYVRQPATLKIGDIVIGNVRMVRGAMAAIDIERLVDQPLSKMGGDRNGTLHISKTSGEYIEYLDRILRMRDIIRAEVIAVEPSIQLTTKDRHLGVIKSYCSRCGTAMTRKGNGLICPECEWKDSSKLADDFGEGFVQ